MLLSPRAIIDRITVTDASSWDRYYMWQAGLDMIMDKPIFGQGTGMILEVYPKYRWQGAPNPNAPHLHNNFIQVAAERGLPSLVFLGWILYLLAREAWRVRDDLTLRRPRPRGPRRPRSPPGCLNTLSATPKSSC